MQVKRWWTPVLAVVALPMTIAATNQPAASAGVRPSAHVMAAGHSTAGHLRPATGAAGRPLTRALLRPATVARPRPVVRRAVVAPRPVVHRAATVTRPVATRTVSGPTSWSALNAAIARIPTYHAGGARWVISTKYGHWGTADWYHDTLYISPNVPDSYLYDVAVHEWSHELSVLDYAGDVEAATTAMNAWFGGSDLVGAERAADCMAILQGADWTHYTPCTDSHWRAGAARLVAGQQL